MFITERVKHKNIQSRKVIKNVQSYMLCVCRRFSEYFSSVFGWHLLIFARNYKLSFAFNNTLIVTERLIYACL